MVFSIFLHNIFSRHFHCLYMRFITIATMTNSWQKILPLPARLSSRHNSPHGGGEAGEDSTMKLPCEIKYSFIAQRNLAWQTHFYPLREDYLP